MKLGIDYGTTRIVAAYPDRGNYPIVQFPDLQGDVRPYLPSVIAADGSRLLFGFEAEAAARRGAPVLRSFKRLLAGVESGYTNPLRLGEVETTVYELFVAQARAVRARLIEELGTDDFDVTLAVPAHAFTMQRLLTMDAFAEAGFTVRELLNEPSASGIEYAHRYSSTISSRRTRVLVFDFGGGTFDASIVDISGRDHTVLATRGDNSLGGEDLDAAIIEVALAEAGLSPEDLSDSASYDLYEQSRAAKESLVPQSRRIVLELEGDAVVLPVERIYEATEPIIERTLRTIAPLLEPIDRADSIVSASAPGALGADIAGLYLVGGASQFPAIGRSLRETFGRRVRRSHYPAASTAIGLAIAADPDAGVRVRDQLSRGVGVFREDHEGRSVTFDPLLAPDTPSGVVATRRYRPAHNVGHYRFVEYTRIDPDGVPRGEVRPLAQVLMPFSRELQERYAPNDAVAAHELRRVEVTPAWCDSEVEETYTIDEAGIVRVQVRDLSTGYEVRGQFNRG
ncbi:MAG: Hsp70 family protein [Bowdeniella nasicola]|nr:Hsp70 family protein [Bowdeniella nasicola]